MVRAPRFITTQALRAQVPPPSGTAMVSHPIPPLPERPPARRAIAPEMLLTADRTNYLVSQSEFPIYSVTGASPGETILWSAWLDGTNVMQDQPFGNVTGGNGNWFGRGSEWAGDHVGFWVITARTLEWKASIRFVVSPGLGEPQPTPPSRMLGVTHVGGFYRFATPESQLAPESFLVEGAKHVRNLGAKRLSIYISPQYRRDYPFDDFGSAIFTNLTALASSPEYTELFNLPFETFVLTAYTFANWQWIQSRGQPGAVPFDAKGEREEFAGLVRHLAAAWPGKNFILKNWEGDWQLKLSFDLDGVASEQQVAEFIEWMRARQEGIGAGREGLPDKRVQHAIEFNLIHQAQRGLPSMLGSVIPQVESDLIAYACWWSLGRTGEVSRNLRDDVIFIRNLPGMGVRPIIITEFGLSYLEPQLEQRTRETVDALSLTEVPLALYWQIFDNGPDLALIGREATRFESWHAIRNFLGVRNDAVFVPDQTRLPERIAAGRQYPVTIAVRNNGMLFDPVVGYALGLLDSQRRVVREIWIDREVPAGETVVLDFVLDAPAAAGTYIFQMFQHGVELFGEEMAVEVAAEDAD